MPEQFTKLDSCLEQEAYEWAAEHVAKALPGEEIEAELHNCGICGEIIVGVTCASLASGEVHFGCAAAERKQMLLAAEAWVIRVHQRLSGE